MEKLDFLEISNADAFENLVEEYFRSLSDGNNEFRQIREVSVELRGVGADGGKDILVTFTLNDTVFTYAKKWLVQCKFYDENVNPSHLAKDNIPTLIHSYGADGYLLVCRKNPTQKLADLFNRLRKSCKMGYQYEIWNGDRFLIRLAENKPLIQRFFPKHYTYLQQNRPQL
jgi:hypothetical protein